MRRLQNLGVSNVVPNGVLLGPASSLPVDPAEPHKVKLPALVTPDANDNTDDMSDCCICLFPVTVSQALFVAPCSHAFHYKCMRPLLLSLHPGFTCPMCRAYADLESEVEKDTPAGYLKLDTKGEVVGVAGQPGTPIAPGAAQRAAAAAAASSSPASRQPSSNHPPVSTPIPMTAVIDEHGRVQPQTDMMNRTLSNHPHHHHSPTGPIEIVTVEDDSNEEEEDELESGEGEDENMMDEDLIVDENEINDLEEAEVDANVSPVPPNVFIHPHSSAAPRFAGASTPQNDIHRLVASYVGAGTTPSGEEEDRELEAFRGVRADGSPSPSRPPLQQQQSSGGGSALFAESLLEGPEMSSSSSSGPGAGGNQNAYGWQRATMRGAGGGAAGDMSMDDSSGEEHASAKPRRMQLPHNA